MKPLSKSSEQNHIKTQEAKKPWNKGGGKKMFLLEEK